MPLSVRGGGGTCAQSCAGLSFAWMFFVEIKRVKCVVFRFLRVIVDFYGLTFLRTAIDKVYIKFSFVGNIVYGIGKEDIVGI